MITAKLMRQAGVPDHLILRVLELEHDERCASRREQNRINKRNQRSRQHVSADVADTADTPLAKKESSPHTPLKEKNSTPLPTSSDAAGAAQADVRTELFNSGLELLARISGRTPNSCRSILGKMLKAVDDDPIHVLAAIEDAARERVADPVPWIWGRVNAHSKRNGGHNGYQHKPTAADILRGIVEDNCRRESPDFGGLLPQVRRG